MNRVEQYISTNLAAIAPSNWSGIGKTLGQMKLDDGLRWVAPLELKATVEKLYEEKFGSKEEALKKEKEKQAAAKKVSRPRLALHEHPRGMLTDDSETPGRKVEGVLRRVVLRRGHSRRCGLSRRHVRDRMALSLAQARRKRASHPRTHEGALGSDQGQSVHPIPSRTERLPPRELFLAIPLEIDTGVDPRSFAQIGHSKAIAVNFGYARYHQGHCYLRYDDTNPEAEEQIYFDKILENVRWLGYEPYQITHSSDHFQELYDLAKLLIKKGLAYTSNDTGQWLFYTFFFFSERSQLTDREFCLDHSRGDQRSTRRTEPRPAVRIKGPQQADRAVPRRV